MRYSLIIAILIVSNLFPSYGHAAEQWQIASKSEAINFGQKITISIVKLDDAINWPDTFKIKLSGNGNSEEIELSPADSSGNNTFHRSYVGTASKKYVGVVHAELVNQNSNRLVMLAPSEDAGSTQAFETNSTTNAVVDNDNSAKQNTTTVVIADPKDEPALSANEPMYFIMGKNSESGTDARFQLSFKYRPFDPEGSIAGFVPLLSNLYFAYTQTTLWDIGEKSGPFRDTSYRPSLFYRWSGSGRNFLPDEWRVGAEHESNGQPGVNSRSLNTLFIRPTWNFDMSNGRRLSFFPKFQHYLNKEENSDIQRYRGYIDWQLRYGREDGLILGGLYRLGTGGYSASQLDVSYPISDRIFARTGAFLHLQLLSGYGETLLDFNKKNDTQIRLGLSIAR
ncbi:MAG: phospholipase A [Methylophilus sp.]